jgi:hypothetical protein
MVLATVLVFARTHRGLLEGWGELVVTVVAGRNQIEMGTSLLLFLFGGGNQYRLAVFFFFTRLAKFFLFFFIFQDWGDPTNINSLVAVVFDVYFCRDYRTIYYLMKLN